MKISDTDVLIIPGYTNSGPDHWQSRWHAKLPNTSRVEQDDWHKPVLDDWVARVVEAVGRTTRPLVLVAHSLGVSTAVKAVHAMSEEQRSRIVGAFLVAPPDVENDSIRPKHLQTFGPSPIEPLPFPSIVVASRNDPFCSYERAGDMANAWGSLLVDARESGHLNEKSGHGPWPEGLMVFAEFMKQV